MAVEDIHELGSKVPRVLTGLESGVRRLGAEENNSGLFFARLGKAWERIREEFQVLYGYSEGSEEKFGALLNVLGEGYAERSKELRARDASLEGKRPWFLDPGLAAYMLYLDRFAGTFRGLEKRISWLEGLGVNLVHLMPFMKSPSGNNDGGYAVSDYLEVDPRFGTNADLVDTARLLHERGMFLAADLVLNHSADDHPWALAARSGDEKYRQYYYIYPDRKEPDRFEASMPEVFPATAPGNFTWVPGMGSWVMTVFHSFQWDLNWGNPEVFLEMLRVVLGMANRGIDLIRLDAVPYLWKRAGTSCQNLEEAHSIVRLLKAAASVVAPRLAFLAEAIVQPSEIVKYLDTP
ncbi:MAG: alpha-amylase family glycosyl hydrolase, partial [Spirochaetota bacterium]